MDMQARAIQLVLFSGPEDEMGEGIDLENRTGGIWHVHVDGLAKVQLYAYRAQGEYDPARGLRFKGRKLLLEPYAKALHGEFRNRDNLLLASVADSGNKDLQPDFRDDSAFMPGGVAWEDGFDWQGDRRPEIPRENSLIYEPHANGFTAHPSSGWAAPAPTWE